MPMGRPRQFDVDEALDRALEVFWARGYEGATLLELTSAMGINRPSLYAAFGNKEQLFRKVLDRYQTGPMSFLTECPAQADRPGCGRGHFLGVRQDAARPRQSSRVPGRVRGTGVRRGGGGGAPGVGPIDQGQAAVTALRERFERARAGR